MSERRPGPRAIPEIDIWRSANLMIKRHGEDAALQAAMRADALLRRGDTDGCAAWKRILRAIEELRRPCPLTGQRTH